MQISTKSQMSTARQDSRLAIIVISLPDAASRRQVIKEYIPRINLPWRFFEAKRYTSGASKVDNIEIGKDITKGEVGCFLSHISVWKEISDMNVDYAIVLEDDTILIPTQDYHALFRLLCDLGVEVIRLTANRIDRSTPLAHFEPLSGLLCRIILPKYSLGTGCYALTPRAAGAFYTAVSRIERPVDHWLGCYGNHGIPIYNLVPSPAIEMRAQSTIRHTPYQRSDNLLGYAVRRIGDLFTEGLYEWRLSKLDNALRRRIDRLHPGAAVWPHSELRMHLRQLMPWWNSKDL